MSKSFQEDSYTLSTPEEPEEKGSCLVAVLGVLLILGLVFTIMYFDPPGRSTCLYCGTSIKSGIYCEVCGISCRKCGRITSDRRRGYCSSCYADILRDGLMD